MSHADLRAAAPRAKTRCSCEIFGLFALSRKLTNVIRPTGVAAMTATGSQRLGMGSRHGAPAGIAMLNGCWSWKVSWARLSRWRPSPSRTARPSAARTRTAANRAASAPWCPGAISLRIDGSQPDSPAQTSR
jgi:hypothetical protein